MGRHPEGPRPPTASLRMRLPANCNTCHVAGSHDHRSVGQALSEREGDSGKAPSAPEWASASPLLSEAFALAVSAHGSERRPSDGRLFIEHVTEVAELLRRLDFDEELIAVGLLHDSVERGTLSEPELRAAMGDSIAEQVMTLSEDPAIESFERRKAALREQVASAGGHAVTVFAADKLSDIAGLRRGIEVSPEGAEARMDTSVASMAGHYSDSVRMIASMRPDSTFLSALRRELGQLEAAS
jgi:guanosine-3',5'-bis(diphosphate) 3'-pyrophosphohydrolase